MLRPKENLSLMNGTSVAATAAMRLMPPSMTTPASTAINAPLIHVGMLNDASMASATLFDCTRLPIPNDAIPANAAKVTPSHFSPSPCSRTYIGPPAASPSPRNVRYL